MKKITLLLGVAFLLSACKYTLTSTEGLTEEKWATVDKKEIRRQVYDSFQKSKVINKYISTPPSILNQQQESLKKQVRQIKNTSREKCKIKGTSKPKEPEAKTSIQGFTIQRLKPSGSYVQRNTYNQDCINEIENDQLISDLEEKLEKIKEKNIQVRQYYIDLDKSAQKATEIIISEYAKDKYYLVVDNRSEVIYNQSGKRTDITDAIIMLLRSNDIDLNSFIDKTPEA